MLCEDTRTTARLLSENSISARTEALHEHNERQRVPALIERLQNGTRIALVSDAGMPLLSDPGYRLVRAAIEADIPLTVIPGPNAALTALVLSGLPPHPFMFVGFPPPRSAARKEAFAKLHAAERAGLAATLIWHEAPTGWLKRWRTWPRFLVLPVPVPWHANSPNGLRKSNAPR